MHWWAVIALAQLAALRNGPRELFRLLTHELTVDVWTPSVWQRLTGDMPEAHPGTSIWKSA